MNAVLSAEHPSFAERCTDVYLITMLLVFPLFPGFSGYGSITVSKFVFFAALTGLWAAMLLVSLLRGQGRPLRAPQFAALAYLAILFLSWLLSPERAASFLGAGRYDGFLSCALYVVGFLGVSAFARRTLLYAKALALSVSLCALIALLEIGGGNPLRLFPAGLGYYDAGIRYTGVFLGTVGNTNILDAVLCLSLPLFLALHACGCGAGFLVPVLLCVPLLQKAGGDGARLAMALTLLAALPLLLTALQRVRRFLRACAAILAVLAVSALWQPTAERALRFVYSPQCVVVLAAAAACFALSLLTLCRRFSPSPRALRTFFLCVSAALLLAGAAAVFLVPVSSGTVFELRQLLRGRAEDSFGSSRLGIWRACLKLIPERPLLGGGPGTLALRLDIRFSRFVPETGQTLSTFVDNAHNVYLGALVDTGFFGLFALLGVLAVSAVNGIRRRRDPLILSISLGAVCCAIHAFFGLGLCLSAPLFWLLLGVIHTFDLPRAAASEAIP